MDDDKLLARNTTTLDTSELGNCVCMSVYPVILYALIHHD